VYTCYPPHGELLEFLNRAAKVCIAKGRCTWPEQNDLPFGVQIKATNGAPAPKKKLSKEENKQLRKLKNMRKRDSVRPPLIHHA
jgi:hypothetical protein